jgi:prepilin-type processing-associated H-X9-DG protein
MGGQDAGKIVGLDYKQPLVTVVANSLAGQDDWPNTRAPRHTGYLNVLFHDGRVEAQDPDVIDPRYCLPFSTYWRPKVDEHLFTLSDCPNRPQDGAGTDTDGDGDPNTTDPDDDNDGIPDDTDPDDDNDGIPDVSDPDDDNDGVPDDSDPDTDGGGSTNGAPDSEDPCSGIDWPGGTVTVQDQFPASLKLHKFEADDTVFLFVEQCGMTLPQDIAVDMSPLDPPSQQLFHKPFCNPSPSTIPAGTVVDVYLVHFDPTSKINAVTAELQFSRPILGVILGRDNLVATDSVLGNPATGYEKKKRARQFECRRERLTLSADMKNVEMYLYVNGVMEEARILVAAEGY